MDLTALNRIRVASSRSDLGLSATSAPLAGGTWLFSEPQPELRELVDLTSMGWAAVEVDDDVLTIAATCTIRELVELAPITGWASQHLVQRCARSLVASEKIWDWATVGGNIALALPAGAMTTLAVALDATAVVWTPDGGERRQAVTDLVTGVRTTTLGPDEVLRSIEIDRATLAQPASFGRVALTKEGRSGVIVVGRRTPDALVLTVTAGVTRPHRLALAADPSPDDVARAVAAIDDWYDDPHGAPDWRAAMAGRLAERIRQELA